MLDPLFSLGGTFYSETLYALPYVYTQFPAELDPLAVKAGPRLLDRPRVVTHRRSRTSSECPVDCSANGRKQD